MIDVYENAVDHAGRYGAAFERDDETAFFYLLDLARDAADQIVEALDAHTLTKHPVSDLKRRNERITLRTHGDHSIAARKR